MSEIFAPGTPNALAAGYATQSLAGGLPTLTLGASQASADVIEFTGLLTVQDIVVVIPPPLFPQQVQSTASYSGPWGSGWIKVLKNTTSGPFQVTVTGPGGSGVVVAQGNAGWYYSKDGVNVFAIPNGTFMPCVPGIITDFPNQAAMVAFDTTTIPMGDACVARVDTYDDLFVFLRGSTLTVEPDVVIPSTDGFGQWVRLGLASQRTVEARSLFVGNTGGVPSDENTGLDALHPLASWSELSRRYASSIVQGGPIALTITYGGGATDIWTSSALFEGHPQLVGLPTVTPAIANSGAYTMPVRTGPNPKGWTVANFAALPNRQLLRGQTSGVKFWRSIFAGGGVPGTTNANVISPLMIGSSPWPFPGPPAPELLDQLALPVLQLGTVNGGWVFSDLLLQTTLDNPGFLDAITFVECDLTFFLNAFLPRCTAINCWIGSSTFQHTNTIINGGLMTPPSTSLPTFCEAQWQVQQDAVLGYTLVHGAGEILYGQVCFAGVGPALLVAGGSSVTPAFPENLATQPAQLYGTTGTDAGPNPSPVLLNNGFLNYRVALGPPDVVSPFSPADFQLGPNGTPTLAPVNPTTNVPSAPVTCRWQNLPVAQPAGFGGAAACLQAGAFISTV